MEFAHRLRMEGRQLRDAVAEACGVRLGPIVMTTLATIIWLLPMTLKLGEGSEAYAPLARTGVEGLLVSGSVTVIVVPVGFPLVCRSRTARQL